MLGINTGFKRNKPRQFEYKPRYFDPEKEEQEARSIAREGRCDSNKYVPGSLVRGMRMERYRSTSGDTHNEKRQAIEARNRTIIRLGIFLFILILVGYIVMNSTLLETVFSSFMK